MCVRVGLAGLALCPTYNFQAIHDHCVAVMFLLRGSSGMVWIHHPTLNLPCVHGMGSCFVCSVILFLLYCFRALGAFLATRSLFVGVSLLCF